MAAIGDKETRACRSGISNRSPPLVPPNNNDYDISVATTDADLALTERTGDSYRSSLEATTRATDIIDDLHLLRKNHFRELAIHLRGFDYIIERIEDLSNREGENLNLINSSDTSMRSIKYAVLPIKGDESNQATVPHALMNEFNSFHGCVEADLVNDIDTIEQSEQWQRRQRRRRRRQRPGDSLAHWPTDTSSACELSIGCSSSLSSSSSSSSSSLSSSSSSLSSPSSSPKFQFHSSIHNQSCLKSMYIPSFIIAGNNEYTGISFTKRPSEDEKNSTIPISSDWKEDVVDRDYDKTTTLPSIIIDDPDENPFPQILTRGQFSSICSSTPSVSTLVPTVWSDYSNRLEDVPSNRAVSKLSSCCSTRAHSPSSGINSESPPGLATTSVPLDSSQISSVYRIPPSGSSPTSSNQSYGDTPSPLNYIVPLNEQIEKQLCDNLIDEMPMWVDDYERQSTMVPSEMSDVTMDTIDNNELQLVEEVIRDFGVKCDSMIDTTGGCCNGDEAAQVVPNYDCYPNKSSVSCSEGEEKSDSTAVRMHLAYSPYSGSSACASSACASSACASSACGFYEYSRADDGRISTHSAQASGRRGQLINDFARSTNEYSTSVSSTYAENQIPKTVSTIANGRSNGLADNRKSDRHTAPWPSLNLPSINASERLKEGLNAKDVERAMSNLLKRPIEELASADQDGDTMLMCLVGNPEELTRKKAYLVPLVERLSNARGSLSRTNNRGEDALYLAAMSCPGMPYVTGYLAAAMIEKGIDIGQKLYHTRGDTLIHSVAARGDTHGEVLAELLSLKTSQGHSVFDLSKRNYDGRTALHVAVESHDPFVRGVSAIATVQLLLENGADARIKETKCGDTALHMATSLCCDPALVKVLLSNKAHATEVVNALNYNYNTPLHMAAAMSTMVTAASFCASHIFQRQRDVCTMLLQAGGQINIENRQGKTPLALVPPERKDIVRRIFHRRS